MTTIHIAERIDNEDDDQLAESVNQLRDRLNEIDARDIREFVLIVRYKDEDRPEGDVTTGCVGNALDVLQLVSQSREQLIEQFNALAQSEAH